MLLAKSIPQNAVHRHQEQHSVRLSKFQVSYFQNPKLELPPFRLKTTSFSGILNVRFNDLGDSRDGGNRPPLSSHWPCHWYSKWFCQVVCFVRNLKQCTRSLPMVTTPLNNCCIHWARNQPPGGQHNASFQHTFSKTYASLTLYIWRYKCYCTLQLSMKFMNSNLHQSCHYYH